MTLARLALATAMTTAILGVGGCTAGPDFERPVAQLPASYAYADTYSDAAGEPDGAMMAAWWASFDDPVLVELVDIARRDSFDLRIAASRIEQARYGLASTRGLGLPNVQAVGSGSVTRLSENSGISALASAFGGGSSGGQGAGGTLLVIRHLVVIRSDIPVPSVTSGFGGRCQSKSND